MEHIDGPTLADWIERNPRAPIGSVLDVLDQVADGLRSFHRRETWHQDLKPANVMFTPDGRVKLVDFGSCRVAGIHEIDTPIQRDLVLGTAAYSAPESRAGEAAGTRGDLFSLGVIAYEMLSRRITLDKSGGATKRTTKSPRSHALHLAPPPVQHRVILVRGLPPCLRNRRE